MKRFFSLFIFLSVVLYSCGSKVGEEGHKGANSAPILKSVTAAPEFAGISSTGAKVTNADVRGKIWIASFFFASCSGPCPKMNARIAALNNEYKDNDDIRFVSFTVDPNNDTPEVLAKYAVRYGAKPEKWHFVRMSADSVETLASSRGFLLVPDGTESLLHSSRLVVVDKKGQIRAFIDGIKDDTIEKVKQTIDALQKEGA